MERRSRSPDSPRARHRIRHRRRSRSWSRSKSRERSREMERRRRSRSRSWSRDRYRRNVTPDLYKDLIEPDYQTERDWNPRREWRSRDRDRDWDRDRDRRNKDRHVVRRAPSSDSFGDDMNSNDSYDSDHDHNNSEHYRNQVPRAKIVIYNLPQNATEADIMHELINCGFSIISIRLLRKRQIGTSRGLAFVDFISEAEATRWMELKQGVMTLQDNHRAFMKYVSSGVSCKPETTDWWCAKCGMFNFRRRENCFKCTASREESEKGGEGSDDVSSILTKKIMLRNLDALTNEEGVLTIMQQMIPEHVGKISKILICRDVLTNTSRGICNLSFDNLVDSMNTHNAIKALDPALQIDGREVIVSYCVDSENKQMMMKSTTTGGSDNAQHSNNQTTTHTATINTHRYTLADVPRLAEYSASLYASTPAEHTHYYTYYTDYYVKQITNGQFANLPTMSQIGETANSGAAVALSAILRKRKQQQNQRSGSGGGGGGGGGNGNHSHRGSSGGHHNNNNNNNNNNTQIPLILPTGYDKKKYPTPDPSKFQYDETSGYYYDSTTGLYYDSNSTYYYNNETTAYLYWDQENRTYLAAPTATTTTTATTTNSNESDATATAASPSANKLDKKQSLNEHNNHKNKERCEENDNGKIDNRKIKSKDSSSSPAAAAAAAASSTVGNPIESASTSHKPDKVKVAKKIVKDMEKWAKQLNQKKEINQFDVISIQPTNVNTTNSNDNHSIVKPMIRNSLNPNIGGGGGYADVGFSILEKKDRLINHKLTIEKLQQYSNKLVSGYNSDSDNDHHPELSHPQQQQQQKQQNARTSSDTVNAGGSRRGDTGSTGAGAGGGGGSGNISQKNYVDFDKLTCLLCKRAFPSNDILNKHLKMSQLHKENLQKYNLQNNDGGDEDDARNALINSQAYRDRAKERRLKYGESDPPPPNRSRERFEKEMEKQKAALQTQNSTKLASVPIGESNLGNRLLQKMGWSEGQGLGRSNQGRTNIIEVESRAPVAGLGTRSIQFGPGDDYKSYIKKMMKSRYEQAE